MGNKMKTKMTQHDAAKELVVAAATYNMYSADPTHRDRGTANYLREAVHTLREISERFKLNKAGDLADRILNLPRIFR